jgi:2-iminobutanoate/2-iminopropanoate deaminase
MGKRKTYYIPGVEHTNPIPSAVQIGNVLHSSLIQGIDPLTGKVGTDLYEQARLCFRNLRTLLDMADANPDDIIHMTVYMKDPSQRQAVNEPWLEWFPDMDNRPARQVLKFEPPLGYDILIQIVAILDPE